MQSTLSIKMTMKNCEFGSDIVDADDTSLQEEYVLRELAESKTEAMDPDAVLEDLSEFMREWAAKREARQTILQKGPNNSTLHTH